MQATWLELRHAVRSLRRTALVSVAAILSIGISVGAVTAVFSWMDALVLHPFPAAADQARLVGLEVGAPNGGMGAWSYSTFKELRSELRSFTGVAAWRIIRVSTREPGEDGSTPLLATTVSGNYFDVLGVAPIRGRAISDADVDGVSPVAVIGHQYWLDRYHGDPSVIGKTLLLNGQGVKVVGIAPPSFSGVYTGVVPQFFVPLTLHPLLSGTNQLADPKLRSWLLFARLAPGISIDVARREADAVAKRIAASNGDRPAPGAVVMPLRVEFLGATLSPLFVAMLAVSVLLVALAAANVASLLLMRADARQAEIAMRRAIGASQRHIVQFALAESLLLAAAGSAMGVAAAYAARGALYSFVPRGAFPISLPIPINGRVLVLALAAAAGITILCGLAPAFAGMRVAARRALGAGGRGLTPARTRVRSVVVSGQLALCVVSLVLAGMFARGLRVASAADVGFSDPAHVLLVDTDFGAARLTESTGATALRVLLQRLRALPGVKSASAASMVPLGFGGRRIVEAKVEGFAPGPNENMGVERAHVGSDYAATMKISVLRGRDLTDEDRDGSLPVAMVNEAFVKRFLTGTEAIGHRIDVGRGWATIVGVLHDGKYDRLDEPLHPVVYVPAAQWFVPGMTIHVRTAGSARAATELVRRSLLEVHVDLPALQARTLAEHISASTFVPRTGATIVGAFAAVALVLSVVGLYAALAFSVALRRREIAVRMAMGARGASIAWTVGRRASAILVAGIVSGALLSFVGGALMRARISSLAAPDASTGLVTALVVILATATAAWLPARAAVRVDPATALRGD